MTAVLAAPAAGGLARHGAAGPRGQVAGGGRYGRMFAARAWDADERALQDALATRLAAISGGSTDNFAIPAGYTYLGQFVDHDVTFDPTSRLRRGNDLDALADFRTPRLDLDSLYGSGPLDQPYLYDWEAEPRGVKLLVGRGGDPARFAPEDLPRNQQDRALIGDPRNDEHLIVAQLHLLFIRFHNKVVDWLGPRRDAAKLFEEAQRLVRRHYQWVVMHDLLPRIVGSEMAADVYRGGHDGGPPVVRRYFTRELFDDPSRPFMPVEFSGGAYRFGHSMVREDYTIDGGRNVPIFARPPGTRHLGGVRRLPADLVIGWEHFFETSSREPQRSKLIDTSLANALLQLPPDAAGLARLNVRRGQALALPSGRDVARAMGVPELTDAQLLRPLGELDDDTRAALPEAMPLWYYVLCEAETLNGGRHLGPVGGRIVAEVLAGLLQDDPQSYLSEPGWAPEPALCDAAGEFKMPELVRFAAA